MDMLDLFFKQIQDAVASYKQSVINKEFVNKRGYLEEIPINTAKGKIEATEQLSNIIAVIYKKHKANLDNIE